MQLAELAKLLGCELRGDGERRDQSASAPIESAGRGDITFVANPRYRAFPAPTGGLGGHPAARRARGRRCRRCARRDPYLAFAKAVEHFHRPLPMPPGIHPTAQIAASARSAPDAAIGAYAVIGDERAHRRRRAHRAARRDLSGGRHRRPLRRPRARHGARARAHRLRTSSCTAAR